MAVAFASFTASAEEPLLVVEAGPDFPLSLVNRTQCTVDVGVQGPALNIEESIDPYSRIAWEFAFPLGNPLPARYVIEIVHRDTGAGVIEATARIGEGGWGGPSRQVSYTRLNTKKERSAFFEFSDNTRDVQSLGLRVLGLQGLRAIRLHEAFPEERWELARAAIPVVTEPMITLQRQMDRVITAGVGVLGNDPSVVAKDLESVKEFAPLARALGFNGVELYVRWNMLEPQREGEFDFAYYDAIVAELTRNGLQWFPLLIVGSAYALPDWFLGGPENKGFVCLEHGISDPIQSIWSPHHARHVSRVLKAFGDHYGPTGTLLGVRLGPSGNYGESQYPAGGNWPAKGKAMHIHIGLWCGDPDARADFRADMAAQYGTVTALNAAWGTQLASFDAVDVMLGQTIPSMRRRIDQMSWYSRSMSDWCAWWAREARRALPETPIYQSAGGWGFLEAGTDYSAQTKAMKDVHGGIRLTNETDSYEQNFYATRLAVTAARHYGVPLGFEPASSHTARGVAGRVFSTLSANGDHWFTYQGNLWNHELAIAKWLEYAPLFDTRRPPLVEVAVYYPETMNQLDDGAFRNLYAWGFNPRAAAVRRVTDVDYVDERLIRDGFLSGYKVLVFAWGDRIEADVLAEIDRWMRDGGVVIYPSFPRGNLMTVEGDSEAFKAWGGGDTGNGRFHRFPGDMEPPDLYGDFVEKVLKETPSLHSWSKYALGIDHPEQVFFTVQDDGHLLALNYGDATARLTFPDGAGAEVAPYSILRREIPEIPL